MSVKRIISIFSVLLLIIFSSIKVYSQQYKIEKVVIDAGHGDNDPGAVGKLAYEKDIALKIALLTGKYIEENLEGVDVVYTRTTDKFLPLWKRTQIANKEKADLFISIHCNAAASRRAYGTETFVLGMHKSEQSLRTAQKENASILYESDYDKRYNNFDPKSDESYIIFNLFQSEYREQSIELATKVQYQFRERVGRHDRGVKEAGYWVLVGATMPAILVETGFISNSAEEKFLVSTKGQEYLASAIYRAVKEYKKEMESGTDIEEELSEMQVVKDDEEENTDTVSEEENEEKSTEIIFGVQFTTSSKKKPDNSKSFKGVNNVWSYYQNGFYKYVSGKYLSLEEASEEMVKVREIGFSDAFVVAFVNGKRVTKDEALNLLNN